MSRVDRAFGEVKTALLVVIHGRGAGNWGEREKRAEMMYVVVRSYTREWSGSCQIVSFSRKKA